MDSSERDHFLTRTSRGPWWRPLVQSGVSLQTVFGMLLLMGSALLCVFVALNGENYGTQVYIRSALGNLPSYEWVKTRTSLQSMPNKLEDRKDFWRVNFTEPLWRAKFLGKVNLHVFEEWCGSSIASLRDNVNFPLHPHVRTTVKTLAVAPQKINYGLRIFGFLHPPADGEYEFALSSDDNSELWLSSDHSPLNVQLRAWVGKTGEEWTAPGEFDKFYNQTSMPIRLSAQIRYFFEVLLKQNDKGTDHILVAWRHLDQSQDFAVIQSEHISLYVDESSLVIGDIDHIPQTVASHEQNHLLKSNSAPGMRREDPRDSFYKVPLINITLLSGLLPDCVYKPSYNIKGQKLARYQGLNHVYLSYVYPNDHTRLAHLETENPCYYPKKPDAFHEYMVKEPSEQQENNWAQTFKINPSSYQREQSHTLNLGCRHVGNIQIREAEVKSVVEAFMERFTKEHKGWTLERVVNVVMNNDVSNGRRYLLELELREKMGTPQRLSHYIYVQKSSAPNEQPKLCNPVGFKWKPEATVNFVITVKNQAKWVHLLIKDMEKLAKETGDLNFNLILLDFNSTDMNIEAALTKSHIPRYQLIKLAGKFEKTRALQVGFNLIEDPHSIVFLFDLHIRYPLSILDLCRKHCVEGIQAFAPIVMRLDCGASPNNARGFWEVHGFGLLGIYKSDLDRVGEYSKDFNFHWGGEDWDMLDRILMSGLEVERLYMRNFYHYFHTKRGMWASNTN